MTPTAFISCDIGSTDYSQPLGLEIWLDHDRVLDLPSVTCAQTWRCEIPDDEAEHTLRFVMKNKTQDHTTVDANNQIVKDVCLTIHNLEFDNISLGHALTNIAVYTHDYNGTGATTQQKFYGTMGCNGTVTVPFSTPIYMWMLDNL